MWSLAFSSNLDLGRRAFIHHLTDQAIQALQRPSRPEEGQADGRITTEVHLLLGQVIGHSVGQYGEGPWKPGLARK